MLPCLVCPAAAGHYADFVVIFAVVLFALLVFFVVQKSNCALILKSRADVTETGAR